MASVTVFVLTAGSALLSAAPMEESAVWAKAVEPPSKVVSYTDLNLNSAEGMQTLDYRLRRAAKEVCNYTSLRKTGSLHYYMKTRQCYEKSFADAYSQIPHSAHIVAVTR
jgi:UrcA family protein